MRTCHPAAGVRPRRLAACVSWGAVALLCLYDTAMCRAQDAKIHTSFEPDETTLFIGQKGTLVIELLAPGYFSGTPAFDLPNVPGAVLVPPSGSPVVGSRDEAGVSYTLQRHEVAVIFHRIGQQTLPPFHVRFAFRRAALDKEVVAADETTDSKTVSITAPPGAEDLPSLICANDLTVDEQWSPEPGDAKVGDAFTRTITFSADDVPGMAFPPFPTGATGGLRTYRQEPEVLDDANRGQFVGKRRDAVTYVCERTGTFTIPAVQLTWWDLDNAELKTINLPARTLRVAFNPALQHGATDRPSTLNHSVQPTKILSSKAIAALVAIFIALGGLAWLAVRRHWLRQVEAYFRPVVLSPLNTGETASRESQE